MKHDKSVFRFVMLFANLCVLAAIHMVLHVTLLLISILALLAVLISYVKPFNKLGRAGATQLVKIGQYLDMVALSKVITLSDLVAIKLGK